MALQNEKICSKEGQDTRERSCCSSPCSQDPRHEVAGGNQLFPTCLGLPHSSHVPYYGAPSLLCPSFFTCPGEGNGRYAKSLNPNIKLFEKQQSGKGTFGRLLPQTTKPDFLSNLKAWESHPLPRSSPCSQIQCWRAALHPGCSASSRCGISHPGTKCPAVLTEVENLTALSERHSLG